MAPRRPPFNPTVLPPATRSFCPKSDDRMHSFDEERTHCPACGFWFVPKPTEPPVAVSAPDRDAPPPERYNAQRPNAASPTVKAPDVAPPPSASMEPAVAVTPPIRNATSPERYNAKPPLKAPPAAGGGRKDGACGVIRIPRSAVAEVLGIKLDSLRTVTARAGVKFTPDAAGLRAMVDLLAPRLGWIKAEEP